MFWFKVGEILDFIKHLQDLYLLLFNDFIENQNQVTENNWDSNTKAIRMHESIYN